MTIILEDLEHLKSRLPRLQEIPPWYLSIKEFSERAQTDKRAVTRAVRSGRISDRHMAVHAPIRGKEKGLVIDWNAVGYDYLDAQPERFRPDDFENNPERVYRPIVVESAGNGLHDLDPSTDVLTDESMHYRPVTDITSAKYRKEQLAIEKEKVALLLAKNKAVLLSDVVAEQRQLAAELKAAVKSYIQRSSPRLAAEVSVVKVRQIQEQLLTEVLNTIGSLDGRDHEPSDLEV